jgi:hypothetical protein
LSLRGRYNRWNVTHRSTVASVTPVLSAFLCGIIPTLPTGKTYKALPGSRIFYPDWEITTAPVPRRLTPRAEVSNRGVMMPMRRRTRAADRARRILEEAN